MPKLRRRKAGERRWECSVTRACIAAVNFRRVFDSGDQRPYRPPPWDSSRVNSCGHPHLAPWRTTRSYYSGQRTLASARCWRRRVEAAPVLEVVAEVAAVLHRRRTRRATAPLRRPRRLRRRIPPPPRTTSTISSLPQPPRPPVWVAPARTLGLCCRNCRLRRPRYPRRTPTRRPKRSSPRRPPLTTNTTRRWCDRCELCSPRRTASSTTRRWRSKERTCGRNSTNWALRWSSRSLAGIIAL